MRKSRAVTGEAAPAPAAAAEAAAAAPVAGGGEARRAFDGTVYLLYGGEAATQVAAELAEGAARAGLATKLLPAADFRSAKLERRVRLRGAPVARARGRRIGAR